MVVKLIMPIPPVWISSRIIIFPNKLNCEVSTVISPVTHVAEVAVNKASMKERRLFPSQAKGNSSKIVPTIISIIKYAKRINFSDRLIFIISK